MNPIRSITPVRTLMAMALVGLPLGFGVPPACLAGQPRLSPPVPPTEPLAGPIRALAWTPAPKDCNHILYAQRVDWSTDPAQAARQSQAYPPGLAAVRPWLMTKGLLSHPQDACRTPQGTLTPYPSPWLEHGTAFIRQRIEAFFTAYKNAGGRLDWLVVDFERGFSPWGLDPQHIRAIQDDPRSPSLKQAMGIDDFEAVIKHKNPQVYAWDRHMRRLVYRGLHAALLEPIQRLYPDVKASNYGYFILTPDNAIPYTNGYRRSNPFCFGTHNSQAYYGGIGRKGKAIPGFIQLGSPHADRISPFAVLRWHVNKVRGIRRSSDRPLVPWVAHKSFEPGVFATNTYYEENIYHLALHGSEHFLFWNSGWDRNKPNHPGPRRTAADERLLNRLLEELNQKFGPAHRRCITIQPIDWDSPLIATGMQIGHDQVLWRVTAPPGTDAIRVDPQGHTLPLNGQPGVWYVSTPGQSVRFAPINP